MMEFFLLCNIWFSPVTADGFYSNTDAMSVISMGMNHCGCSENESPYKKVHLYLWDTLPSADRPQVLACAPPYHDMTSQTLASSKSVSPVPHCSVLLSLHNQLSTAFLPYKNQSLNPSQTVFPQKLPNNHA